MSNGGVWRNSESELRCAYVRSWLTQEKKASKPKPWSQLWLTSPTPDPSSCFLIIRSFPLHFSSPYVAEIWLHAIFRLINEDLCCIRNECVRAVTWSSFWARWVLFRWLLSPTVVGLARCGGRKPLQRRKTQSELQHGTQLPKDFFLKCYTKRLKENVKTDWLHSGIRCNNLKRRIVRGLTATESQTNTSLNLPTTNVSMPV